MASRETALPVEPRLASGELPRTTGQLRQAAVAARTASWRQPTIDTEFNIRSCFGPLGPVAVFGPNNFPLAFGSISGGDFAAAIAAGNPVIAKANSLHPATTRLLAEEANLAANDCGLPRASVQLIYRLNHDDGKRLARDPRLAAIGYTGSRAAGLKLKTEADSVGKPIYLELSSVNPVVILPGALQERADEIAGEFAGSCLMGTGQFCTNPGLIIVFRGEGTSDFIHRAIERFQAAPVGTLLSRNGQATLASALSTLIQAGAQVICGGREGGGAGFSHANTLLQVDGATFLQQPETMQTEAFGNASMLVVADDIRQVTEVVRSLEGNLTGSIYSHTDGQDDDLYDQIVPHLRQRVGRLLNDRMPTGVAVSPAMNHGGPFPATGHPGFTAVGIPAAIHRFAMLQCYDNVRPHRLPNILRDENPNHIWRCIDGEWTQAAVAREVGV
jgi:NADP-dependent aldehyde dehydrogenase